MSLANLPGVSPGHRRSSKFVGATAEETISKMRDAGMDTSWWDKLKARGSGPKTSDEYADNCGVLSVYYVEEDREYTVDYLTGEKYLEFKKLSQPRPSPFWWCACCKAKFEEWSEARKHITENPNGI